MPRKGMRSICFNPKTMSFAVTPRSPLPATPRRLALTESVTEQVIDAAEAMIMKWNPETSAYASVTSLFYEDKVEAMRFLKHVNDLQKSMHLLVSDDSTNSRLIRAQKLMQIAMKRLQKELYQILSMNRAYLDPESVSARSSRTSRSSVSEFEDELVSQDDDVLTVAGNEITEVEQVSSMAMTDLRLIAECMISAGYAKECISIYKIIRKSIIDEGIYKLGVEKMTQSQFNKMDWESMEIRIKNWLEAFKVSIETLFNGERILCDTVFAASESIRESCFAEISGDGAQLLFSFPEFVAKSKKTNSAPEKIFRVLDMYSIIVQNWSEIESIFSFDSLSTVRSQAMSSLVKLSESALTLLSEFESTVQKDHSKHPPPGGGIHSLTLFVTNYLTLLADHSTTLSDIMSDWPPPEKTHLPDSFFNSPAGTDDAPAISVRFAWLILVLLCKLDGKSKHYKDVTTSYLFLANNLQHVVTKVRTSNLQYILGEEWVNKHESKVKLFAANYEKLAWGEVYAALPEKPSETPLAAEEVKECFKKFNLRFEEAYKKQSFGVIFASNLRDEIKGNIGRNIVSVYREFYEKHRLGVGSSRMMRLIVRYTPEDIANYLSDLYFAAGESDGSVSSSITSTTSSSHGKSLWLRAY